MQVHVDKRGCVLKGIEVSSSQQTPLEQLQSLDRTGLLTLRVTIDMLPDDILLEVFDAYVDEARYEDEWHKLVHVCQRWRCIVFASPRRLHLALLCTDRRSVKKMLDIWPALPIIIAADMRYSSTPDATNIIAALEQHSRVVGIRILRIPSLLLVKLVEMEKLFPMLTNLVLTSNDRRSCAPVLPDSFLGESASGLRSLSLDGIPFPGLGKLLLSTTGLVHLSLSGLPHLGYIPPEAMGTSLSALSRLESLYLDFRSPSPRVKRESRHTPLVTRVVLPALIECYLKGDIKQVENFVSQIDAPLLYDIALTLFDRATPDTPQLRDFISRAEAFKAAHRADVLFSYNRIQVTMFQRKGTVYHKALALWILCDQTDWRTLSLPNLCISAFQPLPTLEHLALYENRYFQPQWQEDMEGTRWRTLLHPYTSVKDLEVSGNLVQFVAGTLGELTGERIIEVLPALQNIFLQGFPVPRPVQEAMGKFVTARQLSGRPVTVHHQIDER